MLWATEAVPTYVVPGPGMIKIGVHWPRGKLNKGGGQVCRLQVGWFVFEKWPPELRGEEKEGKRPRQGDSGIFLGCPEQACPAYTARQTLKHQADRGRKHG